MKIFMFTGTVNMGNIDTPLELAMINQIDRFSLCIDEIERVAHLRMTASHVKEWLQNRIIGHRSYAYAGGVDRPEITNWTWSHHVP